MTYRTIMMSPWLLVADVPLSVPGSSEAELAAKEVDRRLSGLRGLDLDNQYAEFFDDFIGIHIELPLYDALRRLASLEVKPLWHGRDGKDQLRKEMEVLKEERVFLGGPHNRPSVRATQLNQRLEEAKAEFDRVVGCAVVEMKAFWMVELRARLTAEVAICPVETDNESHNGIRSVFNVMMRWVSGKMSSPRVLPSFAADGNLSLDSLRRKLVEQPPFQLSNYAEYTDAILTKMEGYFDLAAAKIIKHIELSVSSKITSFDGGTEWLNINAEDNGCISKPHAISLLIRPHVLFGQLRVIFARLTPTPEMLRSAHQGIPIGGVSQAALERLRTLKAEFDELQTAKDGLCTALEISEEELKTIRRTMGDRLEEV